MKIYLATDHAGFEHRNFVLESLSGKGFDVVDLGNKEYDKGDDYPDFISLVAKKVSEEPEKTRAIVFGGSGQGEAMVANRYAGVRAAVYYGGATALSDLESDKMATDDPMDFLRLSRRHNNANVLSIGARFLTKEQALEAALIWLDEEFSGDERHVRRIEKMEQLS